MWRHADLQRMEGSMEEVLALGEGGLLKWKALCSVWSARQL